MAQFVPLKVDTGTPEWQKWASQYRAEGNGIPIIYVIRADGQMLYGRSGALTGNALPQMLIQAGSGAGKILTDAQVGVVQKAVHAAQVAMDQQDYELAVRKLVALKKLGTPGHLGSFAQPALKADQLAKQLADIAHAKLGEIKQKMVGEPLQGLVMLADVRRSFSALPAVKADVVKIERKYAKDPQLRDLRRDADALARARALARSPKGHKRAVESLQALAKRGPDTPVGAAAADMLRQLDSKQLAGNDANGDVGNTESVEGQTSGEEATARERRPLRTWTDVTGKYRVRARLLRIAETQVVLRREDGQQVSVPLGKLSREDRRYIESSAPIK